MGVADQDDIYFPRFNIPRPLYLDERERKKKAIAQQEYPEHEKYAIWASQLMYKNTCRGVF